MLKRLLTAVLVLGVLIAFNSTAFSNPSDFPRDLDPKDRDIVKQTTPQPAKAKLLPGYVNHPNRAPRKAMVSPTADDMTPGAPAPDTTTCYLQDYYTPYFTGAPCYAYQVGLNDLAGNPTTDQVAMRFDVFNYPAYKSGLYRVGVRIDNASRSGGAGVPLRIRVFTDGGGLPATQVDSFDFALPKITTPGATYLFTLPHTVELIGPSFHIGVGYGPGAVAGDTLNLRSTSGNDYGCTNAVTGRASYYVAPTWYDVPTAFVDDTGYDFGIRAYTCEFYTSCFTQYPFSGSGYIWAVPDPAWSTGSVLNGMAQRFVAAGPDTLKTVIIRHYNLLDGSYTGTSTNGIEVSVWGDDGSGNVDYSSGALATVTLPGGAGLFTPGGLAVGGWKAVSVDFSSFNLVLLGPFHLSAKMTSDNPADGALYFFTSNTSTNIQTGGSANFTGDTCPWQRMSGASVGCTTVATWDTDLGFDAGFLIGSYRCKDEFYSCQYQVLHDGTFNAGFGMGYAAAGFSRRGAAQKVQGGVGNMPNRVNSFGFNISDDALFGDPCCTNGTPGLRAFIAADNGLLGPGAYLWTVDLTYADLSPDINGWTTVVIPGGYVISGDFYVGFEILPTDSVNEYWYFGGDRQTASHTTPPHYMVNGGLWQFRNGAPDYWQNRHAASGDLANGLFEVDFCSIPPNEWACGPADVWPTIGHDYRRTSHSNVSLSDAYCDLTLNWLYAHPTQLATFVGPIVANNIVVMSFTAEYKILDLTTGGVLATLNDATLFGTTNIRCIPTIETIGGVPYLFVAGGSNNSVGCFDITNPASPVEVWRIAPSNSWGGLGNIGVARYTNFIVQTISGTPVVFFGTDAGRVYAVNAVTGAAYAPWGTGSANPTALGGSVLASGATDGTRLYYGTKIDGLNADLFALAIADGSIAWQLSATGPLQGTVVFPSLSAGAEGFDATVAVTPDDGTVYAVSTMGLGNHPTDGVFYRINSTSGAVKSAVASNASFGAVGQLIVDQNRIYFPSRSRWVGGSVGGYLEAFNRYTGSYVYGVNGGGGEDGTYYTGGVLTCEIGATDLLFAFSSNGYLSCFQADNGNELYNRRIDHYSAAFNIGGAGALAPGHLLFGTRYGEVIDMVKGADRPRLEILHYAAEQPVPFGSPNPTYITFPDIYTNTGCATLNVTDITLTDVSNGSTLGPALSGISRDVFADGSALADALAMNAGQFGKVHTPMNNRAIEIEARDVVSKPGINRAAAAVPPYLNSGTIAAHTVAPGDTLGITVDVNGPLVNRGPQIFFADFTTDDPDFWLGSSALLPEVQLTLIGGCLTDTTTLEFGASAANWQLVTNSGRLGEGDWEPPTSGTGPGNFGIDGITTEFFQGAYLYMVDSFRLATNVTSWQGGEGPSDGWFSMQPDPNFCDGSCKPALTTGVTLGAFSTTGVGAYTPLTGNIICKSYIDSVQNFDLGGGWNWRNYTGAFDAALTMGLYAKTKTFGVVDAPAPLTVLNNVTIEVMKFYPRFGQAVTGWKFGANIDYDVGSDTASLDQSISTVWSCGWGNPATGDAFGMIKLPFGGCGIAPMKNVRALQALQGQFEDTDGRGNPYYDSAYYYMSLPAGSATSQNIRQSGGDQQMHATIIEHDFVGNDTLVFGVAHFAFADVATPANGANYADMARLVNKFVGFGRGDVNNDNTINLADIVYLSETVAGGAKAIPFEHLGDVNADGAVDNGDVTFLVNYYFNYGACPTGKFIVGL